MSLAIDSPILAELNENDSEAITEQAIWATLRIRLNQKNANEAAMYLQHLLSCGPISELSEMGYNRHKFKLYQNISAYDARYNANTEERMGYMFTGLMEKSIKELSKEECLQIATEEAQLPDGAKQVFAEFQTVGDNVFFIARWHHYHKGSWVEADYIQTMVNTSTGKVFGHQRHWHEINLELSER